ncbi:hypothetical protein [Nocardia sp. NPDC056100]|uniref:hypothetical protein n=1 Tax=Nocardia sp. NPDC056100 TaxID=3345712 RepID=UPI0035DEAF8F
MAIDTVKLAALEALLADGALTDGELPNQLRDAGLPEVAHEFERALRRPARRHRHRWNIVPFV